MKEKGNLKDVHNNDFKNITVLLLLQSVKCQSQNKNI